MHNIYHWGPGLLVISLRLSIDILCYAWNYFPSSDCFLSDSVIFFWHYFLDDIFVPFQTLLRPSSVVMMVYTELLSLEPGFNFQPESSHKMTVS